MTNPLIQKMLLKDIYLLFGFITIVLIGYYFLQQEQNECCLCNNYNNQCCPCPNPDIKDDVYNYATLKNVSITDYSTYLFFCKSYLKENNIKNVKCYKE